MARKSLLKRKEKVVSLAFVTPLFVGYAIFTLLPLAVAIIYSLVDYMPLYGRISPVSFDVYKSLFKADLITVGFGDAIVNTLIIMLSIPINLVIGLIFSGLITKKGFKGRTFFNVVFYLPAVTGAVAITLVWKLIFNETQGIANIFLKQIGLIEENINWLGITSGKMYPRLVIILKNIWGGIGGVIILYVAGILNIPESYYEAAELDGASGIKQFLLITVPLLTPITFYHLIVSIIGGLQSFMDTQLLANTSVTQTIVYFIYDNGINNYRYGYASAASVLLAIAVMIITILQFKLSDKWVYSE
ncbi:MAG: sugar ABC transporter permease [Clostridiales bacterium]|nr:sugar ABC transporter permease [Clostridiales bacterium]